MWERPDLYLENSPVLLADKINTPVLLMANKKDTQVPYTENRGLFLSLRRLGKPAWMLEYENELHMIMKEENQKDYEQKMMQFFDHYLKGRPFPVWLNARSVAE